MNFQQLEYIIAVDACRHFVQAAGKQSGAKRSGFASRTSNTYYRKK